jgi:hypothetical protein
MYPLLFFEADLKLSAATGSSPQVSVEVLIKRDSVYKAINKVIQIIKGAIRKAISLFKKAFDQISKLCQKVKFVPGIRCPVWGNWEAGATPRLDLEQMRTQSHQFRSKLDSLESDEDTTYAKLFEALPEMMESHRPIYEYVSHHSEMLEENIRSRRDSADPDFGMPDEEYDHLVAYGESQPNDLDEHAEAMNEHHKAIEDSMRQYEALYAGKSPSEVESIKATHMELMQWGFLGEAVKVASSAGSAIKNTATHLGSVTVNSIKDAGNLAKGGF